jgi:hypothetical protein
MLNADGSTHKEPWINFVRTIDLGHLIAMATFIGGLFLQWNVMDRRLTIAEEQLKQASSQNIELKAANRENYLELKVDVKEIKQTIGSVQQTLAIINATNQRDTLRK